MVHCFRQPSVHSHVLLQLSDLLLNQAISVRLLHQVVISCRQTLNPCHQCVDLRRVKLLLPFQLEPMLRLQPLQTAVLLLQIYCYPLTVVFNLLAFFQQLLFQQNLLVNQITFLQSEALLHSLQLILEPTHFILMLNIQQFELQLALFMCFKNFELFFAKSSLCDSQLFLMIVLPELEFVDSLIVLFSNIVYFDLTQVHVLQFHHQILVLMLTFCQVHVHVLDHIDFILVSPALGLQAIDDALQLSLVPHQLFFFSLEIAVVLGQLFEVLHKVHLLYVFFLNHLNSIRLTFYSYLILCSY